MKKHPKKITKANDCNVKTLRYLAKLAGEIAVERYWALGELEKSPDIQLLWALDWLAQEKRRFDRFERKTKKSKKIRANS